MKFFGFLLVFVSLCVTSCPCFGSASSANIPLNSFIYPALKKPSGLGLIDLNLQAVRPYTRLEAARQVAEARNHAADGEMASMVWQLLRWLENELRDQLVELHEFEGDALHSYLKSLSKLEISYFYQDGKSSTFPRSHADNAHQLPLNYNNFGIDFSSNSNSRLALASEARLARFFQLDGG